MNMLCSHGSREVAVPHWEALDVCNPVKHRPDSINVTMTDDLGRIYESGPASWSVVRYDCMFGTKHESISY